MFKTDIKRRKKILCVLLLLAVLASSLPLITVKAEGADAATKDSATEDAATKDSETEDEQHGAVNEIAAKDQHNTIDFGTENHVQILFYLLDHREWLLLPHADKLEASTLPSVELQEGYKRNGWKIEENFYTDQELVDYINEHLAKEDYETLESITIYPSIVQDEAEDHNNDKSSQDKNDAEAENESKEGSDNTDAGKENNHDNADKVDNAGDSNTDDTEKATDKLKLKFLIDDEEKTVKLGKNGIFDEDILAASNYWQITGKDDSEIHGELKNKIYSTEELIVKIKSVMQNAPETLADIVVKPANKKDENNKDENKKDDKKNNDGEKDDKKPAKVFRPGKLMKDDDKRDRLPKNKFDPAGPVYPHLVHQSPQITQTGVVNSNVAGENLPATGEVDISFAAKILLASAALLSLLKLKKQ